KLADLRRAAARADAASGGKMIDDPAFQARLGRLEADIASIDHHFQFAASGGDPARDPALPSVIKTCVSELSQELSQLMLEVAGLEALPQQLEALRVGGNVPPLGDDFELIAMPYYLNTRAASIYAGSNEVQRDLIARSVIPR